MIGDEGGSDKDILTGDKVLTAGEFLEKTAQTFGFRYNTHGRDNFDSFTKAVLELGVDIITDPITYAAPQVKALQVGGKTTKFLSGLFEIFGKGHGDKVANVMVNGFNKALPSMIYGGALGAGVKPDGEDNVLDRAKTALYGAVAMPVGATALKQGMKGVRLGSDLVYDAAKSRTNSKQIADFVKASPKAAKTVSRFGNTVSPSKAEAMVREINEAFKPYTRRFNEETEQLIAKHGETKANSTLGKMDKYYSEYIETRNSIGENMEWSKNKGLRYKQDRQLTRDLNKAFIDKIKKDGEMSPTMVGLIEHNINKFRVVNKANVARKMEKEYGIPMAKTESGTLEEAYSIYKAKSGKDWVGLEPIVVHTPDIKEMDDMILDGYRTFDDHFGFIRRVKEGKINDAGLTARQRFEIENAKFYKNMLNEEQKHVSTFVNNMKKDIVNESSKVEMAKKALHLYDNTTNVMKGVMLTQGHTWATNNFIENTVRILTEDGLIPAAKAAALQLGAVGGTLPLVNKVFNTKAIQELVLATKHTDGLVKYVKGIERGADMEVAIDLGVVGHNAFTGVMDDVGTAAGHTLARVKLGSKEVADKIAKNEQRGMVQKGIESSLELSRNTVGRVGSVIENAARYSSWKTYTDNALTASQKAFVKDHGLVKAMALDADIAKVAKRGADRVNDMLFDYSKLTSGETEIMKRFIPFYSFASKNLDYWGDIMLKNPEYVAPYLRKATIIAGYDPELSKTHNKALSEYQKEGAFTGMQINEDGKLETTTINKLSILDALETLTNPLKSAGSKLTPIIKGVSDLKDFALNEVGLSEGPETNLGHSMVASNAKPRKPNYNEASIAQAIHLALGNTESVRLDAKQGLVMANNLVPALGAAVSAFIPPVIKRASNLYEKRIYRNEQGTQRTNMLDEFFEPFKREVVYGDTYKKRVSSSKRSATKKSNTKKAERLNKIQAQNAPSHRANQLLRNQRE